MTAIRTRPGRAVTRWASPETISPGNGRVATPQSIVVSAVLILAAKMIRPFFHGYRGASSNFGFNGKFIHQPFGTGQSDPQAIIARGIPRLHRLGNVTNAWPPIASHNFDSALFTMFNLFK